VDKKLKIVIIGPESTGKTTLCRKLAEHYNTVFLEEYAREYVEKLEGRYCYKDLEKIASKILSLEDEIEQKADKYYFVDTSVIVMKVWFEVVYNKIPDWFEHKIKDYFADLYLLTKVDIPWEYDPVREYPGEMRYKLFDIYMENLKKNNLNFGIVEGKGNQRTENAIEIVNNFFDKCSVKK